MSVQGVCRNNETNTLKPIPLLVILVQRLRKEPASVPDSEKLLRLAPKLWLPLMLLSLEESVLERLALQPWIPVLYASCE